MKGACQEKTSLVPAASEIFFDRQLSTYPSARQLSSRRFRSTSLPGPPRCSRPSIVAALKVLTSVLSETEGACAFAYGFLWSSGAA